MKYQVSRLGTNSVCKQHHLQTSSNTQPDRVVKFPSHPLSRRSLHKKTSSSSLCLGSCLRYSQAIPFPEAHIFVRFLRQCEKARRCQVFNGCRSVMPVGMSKEPLWPPYVRRVRWQLQVTCNLLGLPSPCHHDEHKF
jgi:hypothetical protein